MAQDIFLFNGGRYKRGIDDGRVRVPLTPIELQEIHRDPEVPNTYLPNAIVDHLHMSKYDELDSLAVGDRIYVAVVPDLIVYKGMWALPQDSYPGLEFSMELVNAADVYAAMCDESDPTAAETYGAALDVTFECGLGDATCDAKQKCELYGGPIENYRNPAAFQGGLFETPVLAGLHKAMYVRLTVTAVPEQGDDTLGCNSCGSEAGLPYLQWGLIVDDLGVDKQQIADYCNCEKKFCAGCDDAKPCDSDCA